MREYIGFFEAYQKRVNESYPDLLAGDEGAANDLKMAWGNLDARFEDIALAFEAAGIDSKIIDDFKREFPPSVFIGPTINFYRPMLEKPVNEITSQIRRFLRRSAACEDVQTSTVVTTVQEAQPKSHLLLRSLVADFEAAAKQFPNVIHMTVGGALFMVTVQPLRRFAAIVR